MEVNQRVDVHARHHYLCCMNIHTYHEKRYTSHLGLPSEPSRPTADMQDKQPPASTLNPMPGQHGHRPAAQLPPHTPVTSKASAFLPKPIKRPAQFLARPVSRISKSAKRSTLAGMGGAAAAQSEPAAKACKAVSPVSSAATSMCTSQVKQPVVSPPVPDPPSTHNDSSQLQTNRLAEKGLQHAASKQPAQALHASAASSKAAKAVSAPSARDSKQSSHPEVRDVLHQTISSKMEAQTQAAAPTLQIQSRVSDAADQHQGILSSQPPAVPRSAVNHVAGPSTLNSALHHAGPQEPGLGQPAHTWQAGITNPAATVPHAVAGQQVSEFWLESAKPMPPELQDTAAFQAKMHAMEKVRTPACRCGAFGLNGRRCTCLDGIPCSACILPVRNASMKCTSRYMSRRSYILMLTVQRDQPTLMHASQPDVPEQRSHHDDCVQDAHIYMIKVCTCETRK